VAGLAPSYDLVFAGNASFDEIHPFHGPTHTVFGGALVMCSMATVWSDKRVAVITRIAEVDAHQLDPLREAGIDVYVTFTPETTRHQSFHLSEDVDRREIFIRSNAGAFTISDLPSIQPSHLHLAGLTDQEFTLDFMNDARRSGFTLSVDMQAFVRQADLPTGSVSYRDVPAKEQILGLVEKVKFDAMEAEFLTGCADIEQAADRLEEWGGREIMITRSDGVFVRCEGRSYFERFSNRGMEGRTGRGDTTFGSYLARRLDFDVPEALKFAAALASIKIETPGPFAGDLADVLDRISAYHS
jgi:sugar/nucleoside kinase (ribokinase family)